MTEKLAKQLGVAGSADIPSAIQKLQEVMLALPKVENFMILRNLKKLRIHQIVLSKGCSSSG